MVSILSRHVVTSSWTESVSPYIVFPVWHHNNNYSPSFENMLYSASEVLQMILSCGGQCPLSHTCIYDVRFLVSIWYPREGQNEANSGRLMGKGKVVRALFMMVLLLFILFLGFVCFGSGGPRCIH